MIWVYMQLWGWQFAVGFVLLLLVHETGHLLVAKKFGLKVGAPVFIPFMGAFIGQGSAAERMDRGMCGYRRPDAGHRWRLAVQCPGRSFQRAAFYRPGMVWDFLNLFNLTPVGMPMAGGS